MKVFVYEYICATWNHRPEAHVPRVDSLLVEGRAMLQAAIDDFTAIDGVEIRTLLWCPDEESAFRRLADWCDYALIVAPEFDRILETRCRWAVECDATLLGPPPDVVALCADKLELSHVWKKAGVPTPATKPFGRASFPPPVVVKPRDGVGAIDTFLIQSQSELDRFKPNVGSIVQPFVNGKPYSVSFLIGPNETMVLPPGTQNIAFDPVTGAVSYQGGETVNPDTWQSIQRVAQQAINGVPGLFGFVGVDLIINPDMAIEINPRLTTSYVGLRRLCCSNLMELLLRVVRGEPCDQPQWRSNNFRFAPDGSVTDLG